jgi:hypothetical protein
MCFSYDGDVRADLVDVVVIITVFQRGAAELLGYVRCHRCGFLPLYPMAAQAGLATQLATAVAKRGVRARFGRRRNEQPLRVRRRATEHRWTSQWFEIVTPPAVETSASFR